jgi:hypothetical protein
VRLIVENLGLVDAFVNEGLARGMGQYQDAIGQLAT